MKKILLPLLLLTMVFVHADNLKIAAGAGYKKVVLKVIKEYEKKGEKIDGFFGNMRQVSAQVKQTNIALIIGDKNFLLKKSGIEIKKHSAIGEGKVVIAYSKGIKLNYSRDLLKKNIKKIAMPQPKKAIYGIAGKEFLEKENIYKNIKDKLFVVATVPQALTYVVAKEVDASIINLTAAIENKNKIGGYLEVNPNSYSKIEIIAAQTKSCDNQCSEFIKFLQTPKAKKIFKEYGL